MEQSKSDVPSLLNKFRDAEFENLMIKQLLTEKKIIANSSFLSDALHIWIFDLVTKSERQIDFLIFDNYL